MQQAMTLWLKISKAANRVILPPAKLYRMPHIGAIRFATRASMDYERDDPSLLRSCGPMNEASISTWAYALEL
jgi:hypothetical protein